MNEKKFGATGYGLEGIIFKPAVPFKISRFGLKDRLTPPVKHYNFKVVSDEKRKQVEVFIFSRSTVRPEGIGPGNDGLTIIGDVHLVCIGAAKNVGQINPVTPLTIGRIHARCVIEGNIVFKPIVSTEVARIQI